MFWNARSPFPLHGQHSFCVFFFFRNLTNLYLTDDQWHHVCLNWYRKRGQTNIYCDGESIFQTNDISRQIYFGGSGDFVIGQYTDSTTGRFITGHEFVGKITQVNVWDSSFDLSVMVTMSRDCRSGGNEIRWSVFRDSYHGNVQLIESSECLIPGNYHT